MAELSIYFKLLEEIYQKKEEEEEIFSKWSKCAYRLLN